MVETATVLGWALVLFAALIVRQNTAVFNRARAAPRAAARKAPVGRESVFGLGGLLGGVAFGPTVWAAGAGLLTSVTGGSTEKQLGVAFVVLLVVAGLVRFRRLGGDDD